MNRGGETEKETRGAWGYRERQKGNAESLVGRNFPILSPPVREFLLSFFVTAQKFREECNTVIEA